MSAAASSPATSSRTQDAAQAPYACLQPPQLRGFARVQAWLVDRIKRAAIGQLHRSAAGEIWLLRVYLVGEEATECALMEEWTQGAPDWLAAQVATHLADERHHAAAFARALASGTGALLDLVISPEALTPRQTLTQMRDAALAAKETA